MKENMTTVNLEISKDVKEDLQKEAKEKEMSLSGLIRSILKKYLNKNEKEKKTI